MIERDEDDGCEKTIIRREMGDRSRTVIRTIEQSGHETTEESWEGINGGITVTVTPLMTAFAR